MKKLINILVIRLKAMVTSIRVAFGYQNTKVINSDISYSKKLQSIKDLLNSPEGQILKSEMILNAGEEFLLPLVDQYQNNPDLDSAKKMLLGISIQKTVHQMDLAEKQITLLQSSSRL